MPGLSWEERFRPNGIETKVKWVPEELLKEEQKRYLCREEVEKRTPTTLPKRTIVWRSVFQCPIKQSIVLGYKQRSTLIFDTKVVLGEKWQQLKVKDR